MNILRIKVNGNRLELIDGLMPVSGDKNFTKLRFEFNEDWKDVSVVAISMFFSIDDVFNTTSAIIDYAAETELPNTLKQGCLYIGLQGTYVNYDSTIRIATNILPLNIKKGVAFNDEANIELFESLMNSIAAKYSDLVNIVESKIAERTVITSEAGYSDVSFSKVYDKYYQIDGLLKDMSETSSTGIYSSSPKLSCSFGDKFKITTSYAYMQPAAVFFNEFDEYIGYYKANTSGTGSVTDEVFEVNAENVKKYVSNTEPANDIEEEILNTITKVSFGNHGGDFTISKYQKSLINIQSAYDILTQKVNSKLGSDEGSVQSTNIASGAVSSDKFADDVKNYVESLSLCNTLESSTYNQGKYVSHASGNLGTLSGAVFATEYVPVFPNTKYKLIIKQPAKTTDNRGLAFYNKGQLYIKGIQYVANQNEYIFTTPAECGYIRFTIHGSVTDYNLQMFPSVNDLFEHFTTEDEKQDERISALEKMSCENPLDVIKETAGYASIFKSFCCIGDSLTQGTFDRSNSTTQDYSATDYCSYPQQLKRLTCATVYNRGSAGATAANADSYSWLKRATSNNWLNNDDKSTCYIIALGVNDVAQYGTFTGDVSTDIDVDDYNNNATTSVGGYATIIQKIKEIQQNAKIFCVTLPNWICGTTTTRTAVNEKIKAVAELFGCYVIDLQTYWFKESERTAWVKKFNNGSHHNALGYRELALAYVNYIDWIIRNNTSDFNNVQFIGTDNEY